MVGCSRGSTEHLLAAFAEVDITPGPGLRMAGMPDGATATGVRWPLHARVLLLDDGDRRAAIASLDLLWLDSRTSFAWRAALAAAGDVEPGSVMVACTHTHRAPHTTMNLDVDPDWAYLDFVRDRLVGAIRRAVTELRAVELRVACTSAPGWTFNRRSVYRGEQVGTHGPHWVEDFVRVEGPTDDELQFVLATSPDDGTGVGGLVNFACHTTVMGLEPVYSADFAGPLTEALGRRYGGVFAFLQGASGQITALDMTSATSARLGPEHAQRMGEALAEAADRACGSARVLRSPRVRSAVATIEIEQRRPTREQVELARWYLEQRREEIDEHEFTRRIYGRDHTFYRPAAHVQEWFARETIGMWEWQRRTGAHTPTERVEVQAIEVGDLAFVAYPAEMFTEFGLEMKGSSPFATTVVCTLANGWHGYVPTSEAFDHGGYEPRLGYQSRLARNAGERMTDTALGLLQRLHDR